MRVARRGRKSLKFHIQYEANLELDNDVDLLLAEIREKYRNLVPLPPALSYGHLVRWLKALAEGDALARPAHRWRVLPGSILESAPIDLLQAMSKVEGSRLHECLNCGCWRIGLPAPEVDEKLREKMVGQQHYAWPLDGLPRPLADWRTLPPWCCRPSLYWPPWGDDASKEGFWPGDRPEKLWNGTAPRGKGGDPDEDEPAAQEEAAEGQEGVV